MSSLRARPGREQGDALAGGPSERGTGDVLMLGNYGPSLAAARSLSAFGYRVIAGDGGEYANVARSRSCAEVWRHPPVGDEAAFMDALVAFVGGRPEIRVVLPLRPNYLDILSRLGRRLGPMPVIAMPDPMLVRLCLDKQRLFAEAEAVGVRVEARATAASIDELASAVERIGRPCIVRPVGDMAGTLPGGRKAVVLHERTPLVVAFPTWPPGHSTLLVQRYAPGPRHNIHFAARAGRIIARAETVALRTDRFDGTGLGVDGISVALHSGLNEDCDRLVERLGYTGVGLIQFLVPEDAPPHLLEINPRLGTALAFVQGLGLDLARAACHLATGDAVWAADPAYRHPLGRRYAWTSKDLDGLIVARRTNQLGRGESTRWLSRAIRGAIRADVHLTWSMRDPLPTIDLYRNLLNHLRRRD